MNKKNTFLASLSVSILLLIYIGSFASLPASGQLPAIEKKPTPVLLDTWLCRGCRHMEKMGGFAQKRQYPILYSNFQGLR